MQKISDWLRLVVFLVFLMPVTGCANIFQPDIPISLMSNPDKMAYDYFSIRGVNIGNALDAPEPGQWGVQIKPVYFQAIKEAGFNTVRVPIRFSAHTGNKPPYSIDDDFLKIIQETAKNGLDAELIVILDFHHFDEVMVDPDKNEEKLLSLWNQISYPRGYISKY